MLLSLPDPAGLSETHPVVAQIVNCAGLVSKWVGDTPKNIDALFQEARATDAVLCFDEAEGLFGTRSSDMGNSTDRYAAMDVGAYPSQHQVWHEKKRKEKKEMTTPFGVNLMRSQILYQAAQAM